MKIRQATKKDIPKLKEMMMSLARFEHKITSLKTANRTTQSFLANYLPKWISSKKYIIYIAEEKDKIAGFVFGWKEDVTAAYRNRYVGYICDCYVEEKYRGKGFGKALTNRLLAKFKKMGIKEAKLIVLSKSPSVDVWKNLGFCEEYKEMRKLL